MYWLCVLVYNVKLKHQRNICSSIMCEQTMDSKRKSLIKIALRRGYFFCEVVMFGL